MHGRLDTSLPELSEWIVLASAQTEGPSLAREKELAHSGRRPPGGSSAVAAAGLGLSRLQPPSV